MSKNPANKNIFRVAMNNLTPLNQLDTADIKDAADYSILELLFSCLVEHDNEGNIIPALAKEFYWDDNNLIFEFRHAATNHGVLITPHDALISFNRLMIIKTNSHGDLFNFLRANKRPQTLTESFEGIEAKGSKLILKAKEQNQFLLPLLASIDYEIIPQHVLDPETYRITNFTETTGAYRLEATDPEVTLAANPSHWHFNDQMPMTVVLKNFNYDPQSPISATNLFLNDEVDYIPTASMIYFSEASLIETESKTATNIHVTNPMFLSYAKFTSKGLEISVEKRRKLITAFHKAMVDYLATDQDQRVPTREILPEPSIGRLTHHQLKIIHEQSVDFNYPFDATGIRIAAPVYLIPLYQRATTKTIQNLEFVARNPTDIYNEQDARGIPELTIIGVDVIGKENINFISYLVKDGMLSPPNNETETAWLSRYFATRESGLRAEMLQEIHFNSVWDNPTVIPLSLRPFVSVIKGQWDTDFSRLFANDPFWKVKYRDK